MVLCQRRLPLAEGFRDRAPKEIKQKGCEAVQASTVIAVFYYDGHFYLPTCVRSLDGMVGITEPIAIIPAQDEAALAEAIELRAVSGNATLSNADFRAASDTALITAMHLPNRQAFYTQARRWSIIMEGDTFTLIPYKPAPLRGVVQDVEHAVGLNPSDFAKEAIDCLKAQI